MDSASAIAMALALGAGAVAGKKLVEEVVKDAYQSLKGLVRNRYPAVSVDPVEGAPASTETRSALAQTLSSSGASNDPELVKAAAEVLRLIKQQSSETIKAVGVNLEDVEAANIRLSDIIAAGTGVNLARTKVIGDIEIKQVRAGVSTQQPSGSEADDSKKN
ncbi:MULTISPECIES: hypothetical protein [Bradyrhizobium]|uniref:hypothetical protein n=1 Tax=Bradyrhizobium TaxID=374 RepID=UPI001EDACEF8|nr:hypothetical protein [Bradyrhizobium zhengyangense]MCG2645814.1 hypothetical protein [Bradyrhizobium zhengyangense]